MNVTLRADPAIAARLTSTRPDEHKRLTLIDGLTLGALLEGLGLSPDEPLASLLNGEPIPVDRRDHTRLSNGDFVTLLDVPPDG